MFVVDITGQVTMFVNQNIKTYRRNAFWFKNTKFLIRKLYISQIKLINIEGFVRSQYNKDKATQNGKEFIRKSYAAQIIPYRSDDGI